MLPLTTRNRSLSLQVTSSFVVSLVTKTMHNYWLLNTYSYTKKKEYPNISFTIPRNDHGVIIKKKLFRKSGIQTTLDLYIQKKDILDGD
jgi:hypothetical protein